MFHDSVDHKEFDAKYPPDKYESVWQQPPTISRMDYKTASDAAFKAGATILVLVTNPPDNRPQYFVGLKPIS